MSMKEYVTQVVCPFVAGNEMRMRWRETKIRNLNLQIHNLDFHSLKIISACIDLACLYIKDYYLYIHIKANIFI